MSPHAEAKNLTLELVCEGSLPAVILGDETRLLQVLMNLLSNAIKFTERGGVNVSAMATLSGDSGFLMLSVIDTGSGIESEQLKRLFNAFEQAAPSTARKHGGTGLGLTICRQIVELMGGHIDVSSQPGAGSCFSVRLPIQVSRQAPSNAVVSSTEAVSLLSRLSGVRILAAEDDKVNQWVLRELLEQEGAECTIRNTGVEALLDVRSAQAFDVFITDIQMPGLNGYETAAQARKLRPSLPVIGLTAFAMAEDRQKCLDAGMVTHISKPVDADTLVRAIQEVMRPSISAVTDDGQPNAAAPSHEHRLQVDWVSLRKTLRKTDSQIKFLKTFLENYAAAPTTLRVLLVSGDAEGLQRLVHKIQGAVGFLYASDAQLQARAIEEQMLHTFKLPGDLIGGLADTLDRVLREVEGQLSQLSSVS